MVYFVQSAQGGLIKIGRTGRMAARLPSLRTAYECPDLVVLAIVDEERFAEKELHRRFDHIRHGGEWFHPEQELLDFIAEEGRPWSIDDDAPDPYAEWKTIKVSPDTYHKCRLVCHFAPSQQKLYHVADRLLKKAARVVEKKYIRAWLAERDGVDEDGQSWFNFRK